MRKKTFQGESFFPSPVPVSAGRRIFPLFLPFSGCPHRCLFCSQEAQTGTSVGEVRFILERAEVVLATRAAQGLEPLDLAFFGGTFTALAEKDLSACLNFAETWRARGLFTAVRCSTRPDALDERMLARLQSAGFSLVELGIQSFVDQALTRTRRGYSGQQAHDACAMVQEGGLDLGIQLMPGMPGLTLKKAEQDIRAAAAFSPSGVRLYPCLVLEDTGLAVLWRMGEYAPWNMPETVDFLAHACLTLWEKGVRIMRIGLAEEGGVPAAVLAGPRHPSLGSMVQGRALYFYLRHKLQGHASKRRSFCLHAPRRLQGIFWGHGRSLVSLYAELGIAPGRVLWWDRHEFALAAI